MQAHQLYNQAKHKSSCEDIQVHIFFKERRNLGFPPKCLSYREDKGKFSLQKRVALRVESVLL